MTAALAIDPDYGELVLRTPETVEQHRREVLGERALRWTLYLARAIDVVAGEARRNRTTLEVARRRLGATIKQQWSRRNA